MDITTKQGGACVWMQAAGEDRRSPHRRVPLHPPSEHPSGVAADGLRFRREVGLNQAFAVGFELITPIVMDKGISLPGLLARRLHDLGHDDPIAVLPLHQMDGIFAGSDLFAIGPSLDYPLPFVRSMRPTSLPHELALHDRRSRRLLPKITLRDERKNLLDHRRATSVSVVAAFGTGDVNEIERLLSGVSHIGAKRSGGHGEVASVRLMRLDHPHAGFADRRKRPVRAVPVDVWRSLDLPTAPLRNLVARLPRWDAPREICVGPRNWQWSFDDLDAELGA